MNQRENLLRRGIPLLCVLGLLFTCLFPQPAAASSVWTIYNEAQKLESKGQHEAAIAKYKQTIPMFVKNKEYGNAGGMHRRIAEIMVKLKRYDEAVEQWDQEATYYEKAGRVQDSIAVKNKANKLRSTVKLYVETQAAIKPASKLAPLEPANGALLGAYAEQDPIVHNPSNGKPFYTDQFPVETGKKHAAYLLYFTYGQPLSVIQSHINKAKENGTAIELGLQPLNGMGQVKDDAYLRQLAKDAANAGVPIFIRFANEMNGKWVPWYTTPAVYKQKFQLVAKVFHQEAPDNVAMVWAPNSEPENTINDYYPGDAYVDWVGVSVYSIFNPTDDPLQLGQDRSSHIEKLDTIYRLYAARKPIMISEGAVSYMYPEKRIDKTDWASYRLRELYSTLPMLYPKVKAVFWFDANTDGSRIKYYQLTANQKLLQAYKQSIASPYYLESIGDSSTLAYKAVAGSTVAPAKQQLSGYVKTWSPTVASVKYYIAGREAGSAAAPPWTAAIDFAPYRGKKIDIVVKAFDSSGGLITRKVVTTTVQK